MLPCVSLTHFILPKVNFSFVGLLRGRALEKKIYLIKWSIVCREKSKGGVGHKVSSFT